MRQQKIPALHRHQQVLFFPHDGRETHNSVDGQTWAFCPAGDPSGARFPVLHRELLNPGHESAPSSGELSGMESCGRSAELSQSLARAPLHSSPAGCGSPVFGVCGYSRTGSGSGVSRADTALMVRFRPHGGAATVQPANGKKPNCKMLKIKKKKKMNCMTTIKLFRLHFPGEG